MGNVFKADKETMIKTGMTVELVASNLTECNKARKINS